MLLKNIISLYNYEEEDNMKKLIIIFICLVVFLSGSVIYIVSRNNNYLNNILKDIKSNSEIKEEIIYYNKYNNYYIVLTKDNIIVLDKDYKEVYNNSTEKFQDKTSEYEIIYKTDIPMYEETKKEGNTIKYIYYDIYTLDKLDEIEIEG